MSAGHQDKSYLLDHYDHNRDKDHSYLEHIGFQGFSSSTTMIKLLSVAIVVGLVLDNSLKALGAVPSYPVAGCWTDWYSRDNPFGDGDRETLSDLLREAPGKICDNPSDIEAKTISGLSVAAAGDVIFKNDPKTGFICLNKDQPGEKICNNYRVRFFCKPPFCGGGSEVPFAEKEY